MVREVIGANCGIQFDTEMMSTFGVYPDMPPEHYFSTSLHDANASTHKPQATSSEEQSKPSAKDQALDSDDASKPLHDELVLMPLWWILEVIPLTFSWQDKLGQWHKKWELHLGRGRYKNDTDPLLFHKTVEMRLADTSLNYKPKLKYKSGDEQYVW